MTSKLKAHAVDVSEKIAWIWFQLISNDSSEDLGEATLNGRASEVFAALSRCLGAVAACDQGHGAKLFVVQSAAAGVVGKAIASGLEQA